MHSYEICGSVHLSQPTPEDYDPRPEGVRILVRGGAGRRPATPMNQLQPPSPSKTLRLPVLLSYYLKI